MNDEYFVPINSFEGLYSISNYGKVYGHKRGKRLSISMVRDNP